MGSSSNTDEPEIRREINVLGQRNEFLSVFRDNATSS